MPSHMRKSCSMYQGEKDEYMDRQKYTHAILVQPLFILNKKQKFEWLGGIVDGQLATRTRMRMKEIEREREGEW